MKIISAYVFNEDVAKYSMLYVPYYSIENYASAYGWRNFMKIRPTEESFRLRGDINKDGKVSIADVSILVECILKEKK